MTTFFVRHPVPTWMVFAVFMLLGIYSLPRLEVEALPEVDLPSLTIRTYWNGASPRAIQTSITIPVEAAVRRLHGVEEVKSTSYAGRSQVEVSFRRDKNIDFARVELNEQLGAVRRNLPLNAGQPEILPYVPEEFQTENFLTFSLASPLDPNELREMTETWVVPQVLALEGVADARVLGGAQPLIKILLDRQKLDRYDITPDEVFASLDRLDALSAAGVVRQAGAEKVVALREPVEFDRLRETVIAKRGGRIFTLGMIGEIRHDFEDPVYLVRRNGDNVVGVQVDKRSGGNTIRVSRTIRSALPRIQAQVPFPVEFEIDEDQGDELEEKLIELIYRSLIILGLLFLLLAISLRQIRLTAIITGSIIFAVVISLSLFYFLRISVNFITISGLAVCFGLILDNSILVLDAIHRRLGSLDKADAAGLSRSAKMRVAFEMIVGGSREVLFPILATTLTTIVAFVSFIFLSGRLALFYVPLGIAVTTALIASLFVAFGWVPMVLHTSWARRQVLRSSDGPNDVVDPKELATFTDDIPDLDSRPPLIERVFQWNQRLWWILVPGMVVLVLWGGWIPGYGGYVYNKKVIKGGFWRIPDVEELLLYIRMPSGTDIQMTSETLIQFEAALEPIPQGAKVRSQVFGNQAFLQAEFSDSLLASPTPMYYRTVLTDIADKTGAASIFIRGFAETPYLKGTFGGASLNSLVKITGYNSSTLEEICNTVLAQVQKNRRVRNARVTTESRFGRGTLEEVLITVNRDRLATFGLSVVDLTRRVRRLLGVDTPWSMIIDGEQEQVQLSFYDSETMDYADAMMTMVRTPTGQNVRLADLIDVQTVPLSGSISREDQRYTSFVNWEYVGTDQMRQAYIKSVLGGLDLPYGYDAEESTREFFTEEEEEELGLALLLAIVFISMVLAALFESITLPLLVLMSLPMGLVGVFVGFWWSNASFDSSARIGLILLFGIVVNNAILLASRFRTEATLTLRARLGGEPSRSASLFPSLDKQLGGTDLWRLPKGERAHLLRRAVGRATRIRLRSILLTSGTTIVGLAPLLINFGDTSSGDDIWENLARASIGGLASSTVLIVLIMPPLYYLSVRVCWVWRVLLARLRRSETVAS